MLCLDIEGSDMMIMREVSCYLHNAVGHLYPELSEGGPAEPCHHFQSRFRDMLSQSMAYVC